jgi:hypoxanthine phosphoribosyltransferase
MTGRSGRPGSAWPGSAWPQLVVDSLERCHFGPGDGRLTCAVSGGADSLALLVLATATGRPVTAVHVDHGLRADSGNDAEVVARAADRFGAACALRRVAVADGPNLEARARAARRAALGPDTATGHTIDDQAETALANLLRGSGPNGLGAMRPGPLHPMLNLRRAETRAICRSVGLAWVEDPSNNDARFTRNRIRHELLPLCAAVARRDPVPVLARLADLVRADADLLDLLAEEAVPDPTDARRLASVPDPLARRAVRRWLRATRATGVSAREAVAPFDRHPPSLSEVDRVLTVARHGAGATELGGSRVVTRSKGRLTLAWRRSDKVSPVTTEEATRLTPQWADPEVGDLLVSAEALAARVAELGAAITRDYAGDAPLLVGVLKGAMMFMSDLSRAIELPVDMDFMAVASYGSATRTSGVVRIVKDLDAELTGRQVLVVEDIIDSGLTLSYLRKYLQARRPAGLEICALLVNEGEQRVDLDLRYVGFRIPSAFVVGYGLDVSERYRNLPGIHVLGDHRGDGGGR